MTAPSHADFRWRDVWLPAYGPSLLSSVGHGALMPVLALRARDLGADVSTAAAIVGALSLGMLLTSLPAGALVARIGERTALTVVGFVDAAAMVVAAVTDSVPALAGAVLLSGACWTVFLISRQGFLIDVVPVERRARSMSLLGGSYRVGMLVGPLLGAGVIGVGGLASVFWLAAVASVASAVLARLMPDLGTESRARARDVGHLSVRSVVRDHHRVLATLGVAVVVLGVARSLRTSLLPLWAEHVGLSATTTSLVFGIAAAVDVALLWPGGWLMDRRGRSVVAVPVVLATAIACFLLPLATTAATVTAVMVLIAAGNGLGSGIVMTMGADTAPADGRAQYLGAWRLCGDVGNSGGPLLVGALAAAVPLASASLVLGALTRAGTGWVGWWTRGLDRRLALSRR